MKGCDVQSGNGNCGVLKKLGRTAGMTLMETLVALLLLGMMSGIMLVGVNSAAKTYRQSVAVSEVQTAASTLMQVLANELRYAQDVTVGGYNNELQSYTSLRYGKESSLVNNLSTGQLQVGDRLLVSSGVYAGGNLRVTNFSVTFTDGIFTVKLTLENGEAVRDITVKLQQLNYNPAVIS